MATSEPTWRISYGAPGRFNPRPAAGYRIGDVRRETLWEDERAVPPDAPGYQRLSDRSVSAIVTVLKELAPVYCRDEDGNNPPDLIGEDGWLFQADTRIATAAEAAEILATEAADEHRGDLDLRCGQLFGWLYSPVDDAQLPGPDDMPTDRAVQVPCHHGDARDEIRVDETAGVVWTLTYNGRDGDNWSRNNLGSWVVLRQPLTEERRQLIRDLRLEYEVTDMARAARASEEAARALLAAGWTVNQARDTLGGLRLETADDVAQMLDAEEALREHGWIAEWNDSGPRFSAGDAVLLARQEVPYKRARGMAEAGIPVSAMPTTTAPRIAPDATRVIVKPHKPHGLACVFDDAAKAQAWLDERPDHWRPDLIIATAGPSCVHRRSNWSLWSDGALVVRNVWFGTSTPQTLTAAAVTALDLVAAATPDSPVRKREVWHPLREAVEHHCEVVTKRESGGHGSSAGKALTRHDFGLSDGTRTQWWELHTFTGWAGEDADYVEDKTVWPQDQAHNARAAYEAHKL